MTVSSALAVQGRQAGLEVVVDLPNDPWPAIVAGLERGALVVADNLDQKGACPPSLPKQGFLVGAFTMTTSPAWRGPGSLFLGLTSAVVLWPGGASAGAALGLSLPANWVGERHPGRGLVWRAGRFTAIQAVAN